MKLIEPSPNHQASVLAYWEDHKEHGEDRMGGSGGLHHMENYEAWLKSLDLNKHHETYPSIVYLALIDACVVGCIQIRFKLNEVDALYNGHIGFGVRPSMRQMGYASTMLHLACEICRKQGMGRVLVTSNKSNVASQRTILRNEGIYEGAQLEPSGNWVYRYWINLI